MQGKADSVINGVIHFTSSDPAAVLPIDYQFTRTDAGSHTWTNGFTLSTPGNQTITGQIHDASAINASATIAVSPSARPHERSAFEHARDHQFPDKPFASRGGYSVHPFVITITSIL